MYRCFLDVLSFVVLSLSLSASSSLFKIFNNAVVVEYREEGEKKVRR